jgi:peptidoglycan/xylan/chitin deacetylase (PgdA/CDA1 family)
LISVVVPAFDRGATLGVALDSLLGQTYERWEAIVVDDGSTDDTAAVADAYAARDQRIRVLRQPNGGVSRARNTGIAAAESPWTFFLDSDDWIASNAFELLIAASEAEPEAGAVVGACVRVDEAGEELHTQHPVQGSDLFPLFARTCAIVIHSCLVRTDLVRRAGGFDESLVTCEDWDLWQRIARLGTSFASVPESIAFYWMRAGSASRRGWRMLQDGLRVIDRGFGDDPRVPGAEQGGRAELSDLARDAAKTYFVCYAAGLEIGAERGATEMLEVLGESISADVDPDGIANTLFLAVPDGRAAARAAWPSYPPLVHQLAREFIGAMGERLSDHWFTFSGWNALERMVLAETSDERPRRAGRWYLMELDVDGDPPPDLRLDAEVERILCRVRCRDRRIGDLEIPVVDGWVPARVLADAIVVAFAWEILKAFFELHVYPQLEIEAGGGQVTVARAGQEIHAGPLNSQRTEQDGIHDQIGWPVFLQELWGQRELAGDAFYDVGGRNAGGSLRMVGGECIGFDVAEEPPALRVPGRDSISVAVSVAGAPLTLVDCPVARGRVTAHRLRREILLQTGYELCRAVLREGLLLAPPVGDSLRDRLQATLAQRRADGAGPIPAGTAVIGRIAGPEGTAASRWTVFPAGALQPRLELAERDGDPASCDPAEGAPQTLTAPLFDRSRRQAAGLSDDSLLRSLEFERIFGDKIDPWDYETDYEREKYELTATLIPSRVQRSLELGPAEGRFTRRLAECSEHLTAGDISAIALARARLRCADLPNVEFAQIDAFDGSLGGPYDLVVCSEVLYYAEDRAVLDRTALALAEAIGPGGHLLSTHAHAVVDDPGSPGFDWDVPFGAATIESSLLGTGMFDLEREIRTPAYRVQLFGRRRSPRRRFSLPARTRRAALTPAAPAPANSDRFLSRGGIVHKEPPVPEAPAATRMPILMYHRVAPQGAEATRRWRLHPDDFEAQLSHLREEGYQSLSFEQWRVASDRRQALPERSVMLTFDDGYADFPEYALPLLDRYGFRATMFIVTDLVGGSNVWDEDFAETIELMDWSAIVEVGTHGVEFGSHSAAHQPLIALSAEDLARDFCRSRESFHEHLGFAVRSVCYPFGLHDAGVAAIAGACGFRYGVTTNEWAASFGDDLLALPRVEVRGTETVTEFAAKLSA